MHSDKKSAKLDLSKCAEHRGDMTESDERIPTTHKKRGELAKHRWQQKNVIWVEKATAKNGQ